jgi:hypothetical protein
MVNSYSKFRVLKYTTRGQVLSKAVCPSWKIAKLAENLPVGAYGKKRNIGVYLKTRPTSPTIYYTMGGGLFKDTTSVTLKTFHLADKPENVAYINAYTSRVGVTPLELVHQSLPLPIKVDRHELAVGIQDG